MVRRATDNGPLRGVQQVGKLIERAEKYIDSRLFSGKPRQAGGNSREEVRIDIASKEGG